MREYRFITEWEFETEIDEVWKLIRHVDGWDGWPGVISYRLGRPSKTGVGDVYAAYFRTKLPYTLSFTTEVVCVREPHLLVMHVAGELEGRGICRLSQHGNITKVSYEWEVDAKKRWMRWLAPLLKPAFVWNHGQVMKEGARAVSRQLGARLLSC
ncbi:hypothetical protein [Paenibacillus gansuensis]|uniref:Polyketide cyclase n=1 Tax=Paenibacillus gansuensis TaxID=306542 RepID=A0ABW5PHD5_9BACL